MENTCFVLVEVDSSIFKEKGTAFMRFFQIKASPRVNLYDAVVRCILTNFSPVSHFYTPWKRQKTKGFLTFSGGIEM